MFGGRDLQTEPFQPRSLRGEILDSNGEGEVVQRRPLSAQALIAGLGGAIEQRQDLRVSRDALGDAKEDDVREGPHELQTDDLFVERPHCPQILHPKGNLAKSADRSR
jgi:hypothetical protein